MANGAVRATEQLMDDLVIELVEETALVAHSGGERVGHVRWRVVDDETVEVIAGSPAGSTVAAALDAAVEEFAAEDGFRWLIAEGVRRPLPVILAVPTAADMRELGVRLGRLLRAGDLLLLSGDLGAGKTTLTQGIGVALGVEDPVTSPTFVLSQIHPGGPDQPDLVHVDAYRLAGVEEVADIDLDSDVDRSVTVIEWGAGVAEQLSTDRLEVDIRREHGGRGAGADARTVVLRAAGDRWTEVDLSEELGWPLADPRIHDPKTRDPDGIR